MVHGSFDYFMIAGHTACCSTLFTSRRQVGKYKTKTRSNREAGFCILSQIFGVLLGSKIRGKGLYRTCCVTKFS